MKLAEIREKFLSFYESKGHTRVASSPLFLAHDPTLMFVNSGMVQFKDVFTGQDKRAYSRATSAQRSVRAGGKHNDLENVGYTARHHTFFEMLGNFSFADYFKQDAIKYAWELLTEVYKLPKEKLWVTVYAEDDEAYGIWQNEIGVPTERIIRIGDNKGGRFASDNFWMMGDTGPCGPCSEIFYDHGPAVAGGPPGSPEEDGDRYIEIWNLVFMQFERTEKDGPMKPLPKPCVDTGMGIERLAAILQHVHSNYEIDLFVNLIAAASRETGCTDLANPSLRVIADHIRACAFIITDGVIPSNEGRGYVLRRIIRRAVRHGYKLGKKGPFFAKLVPDLVKEMGAAYPELTAAAGKVQQTLEAEETRFFETLENGMQILDAALAGNAKTLEGDVAFKLHDTFGFPLDLTADVCRERGVIVDEAGFQVAMEKQRVAARSASKFKSDAALVYSGEKTNFQGYDHLTVVDAKITHLYVGGASVDKINAGEAGVVVLDRTPFYAESGGQVGDSGDLFEGDACELVCIVDDTTKIQPDVIGHHVRVEAGSLKVGEKITPRVDVKRRIATERNHSVTHIMHKALRTVLGSHVQQKGSLVDAEKTRFDFVQNSAMTDEQIRAVELFVNEEILKNTATHAAVMGIEAAQKTGAMMLFGEKYGDEVRVLEIGSSKELCGGTHVKRTGDIGFFKITSESGVAAGIRRVEATTGETALRLSWSMSDTLNQAAGQVKSTWADVPKRVAQIQDNVKALEKELALAKSKLAAAAGGDLVSQAKDVNGVKILSAQIEGADAKALREMVDQLKNKLGSGVVLLGSASTDGKVALCAGVTGDLVGKFKAGDIVGKAAAIVGGKGGGRPDMAMAGGTDASKLAEALASVFG